MNQKSNQVSSRGGRLTKWKGRVASVAPSMMFGGASAVALLAGTAFADTISGPTTMPFTTANDVDHTVTSTGSIIANPLAADSLVQINVADYTGTFLNDGTLSAPNTAGSTHAGVNVNGNLSGQIINNGDVALNGNSGSSMYVGGLTVNGDVNGMIDHSGTITLNSVGSTYAYGVGIVAGNVAGTVQSSGTITVATDGSSSAGGVGVRVNAVSGAVMNSGAITLSGTAAYVGATGIRTTLIDTPGSVNNSGAISIAGGGSSSVILNGIATTNINGTLTNSGDIDLTITEGGFSTARGITTSEVFGSLVNMGNIMIDVSNTTGTADARGLDVAAIRGSVQNTGNIGLSATNDAYVDLVGIDTSTISGTFANSGQITLMGTALGSNTASLQGLDLGSVTPIGQVMNSGDISITASGASAYAYAFDVGTINGTVTNTGDITAMATATPAGTSIFGSGYATASGIYTNSIGSTGQLNNSGDVALNVTGHSAYAYGMSSFFVEGAIVNSGNISATLDASTSASFDGLSVFRLESTGRVENSGNITANISADGASSLGARGITVRDLSGAVVNSGDMSLTAHTDLAGGGGLLGIGGGNVNATGSLLNSGAIDVSIEAPNAFSVGALGIVLGTASGDVNNSGDINVNASAGSSAVAGGINVGLLDGTLTHSGTITATADAMGSSFASGIAVAVMNGTLNVTGDISATAADRAYAIDLNTGNGTLNIESSAGISGLIRVGDHDVNLTHTGQSGIYQFEDANTAAGTFSTMVGMQPNLAWVSTGEGTAAPIYAAVNGADFTAASDAGFALTGIMSGLLTELNRVSSVELGFELPTRNATNVSRTAQVTPFVRGDLSDISSDANGAKLRSASLTAGFSSALENGNGYGVGISAITLDERNNAGSSDADGVFLSGVYQMDVGKTALTFGLGIGWLDHSNRRTVGGSPDALADYSSLLALASVSAEREFQQLGAGTLSALGSFTIGQQQSDGYTETGSAANATVPDRTSTFGEVTVGMKYAQPVMSGQGWVSLNAVRRHVSGSSGFDVGILGSSVSTGSSASTSDTFGELKVGYDAQFSPNSRLLVQASTGLGGKSREQALSGILEFKF